jgi:hypothetical protein
MRKNISQWLFGLSAFMAMCLLCLSLYPSVIHTDAFYKICGYTITNAFILIVSYAILRKLRSLAFWRFIVYLVSVVAGNICIDFFLPVGQLCPSPFITSNYFLFFALGEFVLLAFFNFMLSRLIFFMRIKDAVIFGVIISLINNIFCLGQYCK